MLGSAIAITGLMAGLDHWGSYRRSVKRGRPRAQMPVDVCAGNRLSNSAASHRGATCICSHCLVYEDYAGDEPDDDPNDDRLNLWLCDDDHGQKQTVLTETADAELTATHEDGSAPPRSSDRLSSAPSLSSLHVRLQI
jgi:hypothetical protein